MIKKRIQFLSRNRSRPDIDLAVKSKVWFLSSEFGVWLVRAWCVRVPGMASGCTEVLKDMVAGWDLPLWFSATTWMSYSVSHSSPLRITYSLLLGIRISGFHSDDWSLREIQRGVLAPLLRRPRCPPHTHRFISDQVMQNGQAAVVLLDPADLHGVAFEFELPFHFGRVWVSCRQTGARWRRVRGLFERR